MAVTRINNNQITDASAGNAFVGVNAAAKLQAYSVTSTKIANNLTYGSDLTVVGNLTVQGQTTTIDTNITTIEDPVILLASTQTGSPVVDIGFIGERGTSNNIAFVWDESSAEFVTVFTSTGETNSTVTISSFANFHTNDANIGGNIVINGTTSLVGNIVGDANITGTVTGGNLSTPGFVSAVGNATGGNLNTAGQVVATGNVNGGNVISSALVEGATVSASGNVVGGNVTTAGQVVATDTITGGNLATAGTASAGGNITGANVLTGGIVSATGNVTGGNVLTGGLVNATGNVTGGNLTTAGQVVATDTITGGNLATAGTASVAGNITGGNVLTGGQVSATGNVTGGNLVATTALVAPSLNVTGNITGGNLLTAGLVSATGTITSAANITGGNLTTAGQVVATDTITGGNLATAGTASAGGNITGGNVLTGGEVSATGNVTGGNLLTAGLVSATGTITSVANITGGNIDTAGAILATGNITGGNVNTAGNVTANYLIAESGIIGNITIDDLNVGNITATGFANITGNITGGNISAGSGIISTTGNINGGNLNAVTGVTAVTGYFTGNVDVLGNLNATIGVVYANSGIFYGDAVTGNNAAFAGIPGFTQLGSNVVMQFAGNVNSYSQINFQNINSGNLASTDYIATADNGDDSNYYVNMGINSSTFDDPADYPGFSPNDAYLHNHGGNLILNPETSGKTIQFMVGGTDTTDVIGTVSTTGLAVTGTVSATGNITGANVSTGGTVSATGNVTGGNLTTAGQVVATANITGGNVLTGGQVSATGNITGGNVNTDNLVGTTINITGTSVDFNLSGNISVSSRYITDLADPVQAQDAATKKYVDEIAQGLDPKASCYLATVAALPAYTYNNGTDGVGATITLNATGNLTVDGTVVAATERVLIKNETSTNAPYNGIYVVTTAGTPSVAAVLTRATDFDNGSPSGEIPSAFTFIEHGSVNADTGWVCTTNSPVTVGTTPIGFTQFSGAGTYSAGNALSLNGTQFNVNTDGNIGVNGSNQLYIVAGATLVTPNIGAATGTSLSTTGNIVGGNLNTAGQVVATGDISGGNVIAVANVAGGNLTTTGQVVATGNITGGNLSGTNIVGTLTTAAQTNVTSVGTLTSLSVTGTVQGGNLQTAGLISATGNVTGGNVLTGGLISATGNVTGGNLVATTALVAPSLNVTGNITGGNLLTAGLVSATGTITSAANITGGNVLTGGQVSATGTITSVANITGGNLTTAGQVVATGNITGGNLLTSGSIVLSGGNVIGANVVSSTAVTATGNVTGGNFTTMGNIVINDPALTVLWGNGQIDTSGPVISTGNITGGNLITGGEITATGNINGTGAVFSGNVTAANFIGNISGNIDAGGANTQVQFNDDDILNGTAGFTFDKTSNAMTVTGNIIGGNFTTLGNIVINDPALTVLWGNGQIDTSGPVISTGNITGGNVISLALVQGTTVTATANVNGGNVISSALVEGVTVSASGNVIGGNVTTAGLISATGNIDGGNLNTVGQVVATGNVTGGNVISSALVQGVTVSASGNVIGGNVTTAGQVVAIGNVTGGNVIGTTAGKFGNIVISGDDITDVGGGVVTINNAGDDVDFAVNGDTTANVFYVDAGTGTASFGSAAQTTDALVAFNTAASILFPVGNIGQRPSVGVTGMVRFNTTNNNIEVFDNSAWSAVGVPNFTVIVDDQFTGDGSTVAFTLSEPITTAGAIVSINGIVQIPTIAYSISSTTLTFTEAPESGDLIDVRIITTTTTVTSISNLSGNAAVAVSDTSALTTVTGDLLVTGSISGATVATDKIANGTTFMAVTATNGNIQANIAGATVQTISPGLVAITGDLSVSGNATLSGNILGDRVQNGTTSFDIQTPSGNANITVGATSNVAVFTSTGANITGTLGVTGNVTGGNLSGTSIVGTLLTASQTNITGVGALNAGSITSGFGSIDIGTDTITVGGIINANANGVGNIGSSSLYFNTVFAKATSAQYADLAEKYVADAEYAPGTVVVFGGNKEVTVSSTDADRAVAGVVSTNPSYIMNGGLEAEYVATVALTGRVPCRVTGTVRKGDLMVSAGYGLARAEQDPRVGTVIGKALENFEGNEGVIEVVVGRF